VGALRSAIGVMRSQLESNAKRWEQQKQCLHQRSPP
jgi:hypothetical protein